MHTFIIRGLSALGALTLLAVSSAANAASTQGPVPFDPFHLARAKVMDAAFSADGKTLFLTRSSAGKYAIVESTKGPGGWSVPAVAPFSGTWRDLEEVLAPSGNAMVFASNRPVRSGGTPIDAFYHRAYHRAGGGNLWIVRRTSGVWGTPSRLPDAINANTSTFSPALAADGTLYFMRAYGAQGRFHIFVAKPEGGTYRSSALAPFSDLRYSEWDPTVAPDGSFVIFSSTRPPAPKGRADLFITWYRNGRWTKATDMGATVNPAHDASEARLAPDLKTLYFSSGRPNQIFRADVSAWTKE